MNRRNSLINQILKEIYFDLNERELVLKKKELRALSNARLEEIFKNEVAPILEANELNKELELEWLNEEYECFRFN
ncbi:hypothetical protein [Clostridium perfringens]|uniref:Uncharacterized protein n=1 Tax=Clostridium perfringens TaxID=1502 RepID=A0A140GR81_CLOPF|nr:hypothetical protein [Clostridium perfringens]AMN31040.1 hypothetical protein JFP838_pA0124 [Clostridium perfringens]